jgi:hypothetical protein
MGALGLVAFGVAASFGSVVAQDGLTTRVFATGSSTLSKPDDITALQGRIFVGWQNGVGAQGEPAPNGNTQSTVVEYSPDGRAINSWQLTGRNDGMSADGAHDRVIASVNEDGNSSLYVIKPDEEPGSQLAHYTYSPNPPVHGGGTDAPRIYRGQIYISASNPSDSTQPAVYRVILSGSTATLAPVFFDNSTAIVANTNDPAVGTTVTLGLSDPDSNIVVPMSSPRFAGDFMLDSQGDGQQIYAQNAGTASQKLFVLNLSSEVGPASASTSVDDTVWATASAGTLYATDGSNTVYAISGGFKTGMALSAVSPGNANTPSTTPNFLATLDLNTGALTRVSNVTIHPKGMVFVSGEGDQGEDGDSQ